MACSCSRIGPRVGAGLVSHLLTHPLQLHAASHVPRAVCARCTVRCDHALLLQCSVASLARLQETVLRTFTGIDAKAPPDGQQAPPAIVGDDVKSSHSNNKNGVGGLASIGETTSLPSSAHHPPQGSDGTAGASEGGEGVEESLKGSFGEGNNGGGAQHQGDTNTKGSPFNITTTSAYPSGSTSADAQEASLAPAAAAAAPAVATTRSMDRTKSHAAMTTIDRGNGNKKRATLTPTPAVQQRSTGTVALAGHGAYGSSNSSVSSKKHGGPNNTTTSTATSTTPGKKAPNTGNNAVAEEHQHPHHEKEKEKEKGLGAEWFEVPVEAVEAIDLPKHVLTEDNCTFWVR